MALDREKVKRIIAEGQLETPFWQLVDFLVDAQIVLAAATLVGVASGAALAAHDALVTGTLQAIRGQPPSIAAYLLLGANAIAGASAILLIPGALMLGLLPIHVSRSGVRFAVTQSYWEGMEPRMARFPIPALVLEGNLLQGVTVFYSTARRQKFRDLVREYGGAEHALARLLEKLPPVWASPRHVTAFLILGLLIGANLLLQPLRG